LRGEFRLARYELILEEDYSGARIQGGRNYQEDDFGFDSSHPEDFLMVLADGMGGHEGGAQASSQAIESFMNAYRSHNVEEASVSERLNYALNSANRHLASIIEENPSLQGMGCTLVGVSIDTQTREMQWISVGDSPLWLYNNNRLKRLNRDHSMRDDLQKQIKRGEISEEEAATHPDRNALHSALTGGSIELVDQPASTYPLSPGDTILLASDGLFALSKQEIEKLLSYPSSAQKTVYALLKLVERKGRKGQDNTTTLIFKVPDEEDIVSFTEAPSLQKPAEHLFVSPKVFYALIILLLLLLLGIASYVAFKLLSPVTETPTQTSETVEKISPQAEKSLSEEEKTEKQQPKKDTPPQKTTLEQQTDSVKKAQEAKTEKSKETATDATTEEATKK